MKHEHCSEQIVVRVPPALRDRLEHRAAAEGRTLANLTRRILETAIERQGEERAA
jgi:predicted DNA-binding protein